MTSGILGKKLGMTQIYDESGRLLPVTVIEAGECYVSQVKTAEKDGYDAIQVAFGQTKERKLTKAQMGHLRKAHVPASRHLREFRKTGEAQLGQTVGVDLFHQGDLVDVQGTSKGKGFQGVMKRFHYGGGPRSHGSMFHRAPGSIGQSSFPSRVWKNKGLPGRMGNRTVTVQHLEVVEVRPEEQLLFVRGAVPGGDGGIVAVRKVKAGKG